MRSLMRGGMLCCLEAFGGSLNYWTLLAINIIVGTIASLVPIPGGGTAVGAVGMSGALTAAGVPTEIAVAAVLANQLVASFIPAVPGWVATKDLMNRDTYSSGRSRRNGCTPATFFAPTPSLLSSAGRLEHARGLAGQRQVDAHRGLHRRRVPDRQPRDHTPDRTGDCRDHERGPESLVEIEGAAARQADDRRHHRDHDAGPRPVRPRC